MGYIQWDREARTVSKGPYFDDLRRVLDSIDGRRARNYVST